MDGVGGGGGGGERVRKSDHRLILRFKESTYERVGLGNIRVHLVPSAGTSSWR